MTESALSNKVCPTCLESNLLEEIKIARCTKCSLMYCTHLASNIDPSMCTECCSDVSVLREIITKEYSHYNEETDVVTHYRRRAKSIRLEGMDWLFAQRKIATMSSDALELAIEYHRALLQGLLAERETRKIEYAHRYAGVPLPKASTAKDYSTSTTTTTKVTKSIKSSKASATADGVLKAMLAANLTPAQIMALLAQAKK